METASQHGSITVLFSFQACDGDFDAATDGNWSLCWEQGIANDKTLYTWEVSDNGVVYSPLEFNSIFTSVHQRQLETVYLKANVSVRCRVQAVDQAGTLGYSRTSKGVLLSQQYHQCYSEEGVAPGRTKITSYETFAAHDEVCIHFSEVQSCLTGLVIGHGPSLLATALGPASQPALRHIRQGVLCV